MHRSNHDEGRPAAHRTASNVIDHDNITASDDTPETRCERCSRPLSRPESVRVGMGWRCAQHERRLLEVAIREARAAFDAAERRLALALGDCDVEGQEKRLYAIHVSPVLSAESRRLIDLAGGPAHGKARRRVALWLDTYTTFTADHLIAAVRLDKVKRSERGAA